MHRRCAAIDPYSCRYAATLWNKVPCCPSVCSCEHAQCCCGAKACLLVCLGQPQVWVAVAAGKVDGWGAALATKIATAAGAVVWVVAAGVWG
jgi:hypothetical protein